MSLVSRAFIEALKFGAPGGTLLALALFASLAVGDPSMPTTDLILPTLTVIALGAFVGTAVAYMVLVAASIATDLVGRASRLETRIVGAGAALAITFVLLAGVNLLRGMTPGMWSLVPPFVVGSYAALVAWFRIPRILGR